MHQGFAGESHSVVNRTFTLLSQRLIRPIRGGEHYRDMTLDTRIARSFFSNSTERAHRQTAIPRPVGTIGVLSQMVDGLERNRLSVLLTSRVNESVCIRSPIGLSVGSTYTLHIGTHRDQSTLLQITSSRWREDGSYDIGARELAVGVRYANAA